MSKFFRLLKNSLSLLAGTHNPEDFSNGLNISNLDVSRKLVMLKYIVSMLLLFSIPFGFLSLLQKEYFFAGLDLSVAIFVLIAAIIFKRTRNYNFLIYSILIIIWVFFQTLLFTGSIGSSGHLWSFIFPIAVMFMIGREKGKVISFAYLVVAIIIDFSNITPEIYTLNFKLRFIGSYSAVAVLSYYIELVRESVNTQLSKKNQELLTSLVELEKAKEKAEKSDMLKSNFLAQMSHEIRTPIYTIMNYNYLLRSEFEESVGEVNKSSFNAIDKAANRLQRTIDLILNISDIETGSYEPNFADLNLLDNIIEPIIESYKDSAIKKNIELSYNSDVTRTKTKLDEYTFNHIFLNLVDNAIKYTNEGKVEVKFAENGNNYLLSISDTGIGIGKEYLPYLFNKFSQEEMGYTRKFDGNGLGLALVKKYCDLNSIKIEVVSAKNEGTNITLKIPKLQNN